MCYMDELMVLRRNITCLITLHCKGHIRDCYLAGLSSPAGHFVRPPTGSPTRLLLILLLPLPPPPLSTTGKIPPGVKYSDITAMVEAPEDHISTDSDCGSQISDATKVRPDESVSQPRPASTDGPSLEIGGSSRRLPLIAEVILLPLLRCWMI